MNQDKRKRLESAGWSIGNAEDFLQFPSDEIEFKYRGYTGKIEFDDVDNMFCGKVINSPDTITFKGVTFREANFAFQDSVDDYLESNKEF